MTGKLLIDDGGLAIWADVSPDVVPLGVEVEFHPGVPLFLRQMTLESVLRRWAWHGGRVTRATAPIELDGRSWWLKGWTVEDSSGGAIRRIRVAFRHNDQKEMSA